MDTVKVTCYGETKEMERVRALEHFIEAMEWSEGSERSRYASIVSQLWSGAKECTDEED